MGYKTTKKLSPKLKPSKISEKDLANKDPSALMMLYFYHFMITYLLGIRIISMKAIESAL